MGATLEIEWLRPPRRGTWVATPVDFTLDVRADRHETFVLAIRRERADAYEFTPLQVEPEVRHLVLMSKTELPHVVEPKQKFLCGHDERHWFVANVPNRVTTVRQAFDALLPEQVHTALAVNRVRNARRYRRHNAGYQRQGEWFFVPQPAFQLEPNQVVFKHEPLRRGAGKAHYVENIVRRGGVTVYVDPSYPNGLTEGEYQNLIRQNPQAAQSDWRLMVRDAQVYARGYVRHRDHKTLVLHGWHRVCLSNEKRTKAVAFLD